MPLYVSGMGLSADVSRLRQHGYRVLTSTSLSCTALLTQPAWVGSHAELSMPHRQCSADTSRLRQVEHDGLVLTLLLPGSLPQHS